MPRKTKKEKLKQHKYHQPHEQAIVENAPIREQPLAHATSTFSFQRNTNSLSAIQTKSSSTTIADLYLQRDLLKTVMLALTAVGILVFLSLVLR